jgi:HSP20 family molecular chaperone IbpA
MRLICCSSSATFRESHDGRMMTATFDLPGIKKNQVHVSYRGHYLIVDWETVKITEHEEGGKIVRDRKEKTYSRTLPIPEGTRVSLCFGV